MKTEERRIPSSDGIHQLYCRVYIPDGNPMGIFHVVHGMNEYIARYDRFMREMAREGYVCYGFDNLGHGYTVNHDTELGYIGTWKMMVEDVRSVALQMKKEFGEDLPCFLLGHSMGSFIARCCASHKLWSKVIFMGTGGPNPISGLGMGLIKQNIRMKGDRAYSPFIEKLAFGSYNNRFREENDDYAWLSTIRKERDKYRNNKYCTFHFTLNGYQTLVKLQSMANSKLWFKSVNAGLPILLMSGSDDPVGDYGKGVQEVYDRLKRNGKNVRMKLYQNCRHEILNDVCHDEVVQDILLFIS